MRAGYSSRGNGTEAQIFNRKQCRCIAEITSPGQKVIVSAYAQSNELPERLLRKIAICRVSLFASLTMSSEHISGARFLKKSCGHPTQKVRNRGSLWIACNGVVEYACPTLLCTGTSARTVGGLQPMRQQRFVELPPLQVQQPEQIEAVLTHGSSCPRNVTCLKTQA
jgi:hypothetical protein